MFASYEPRGLDQRLSFPGEQNPLLRRGGLREFEAGENEGDERSRKCLSKSSAEKLRNSGSSCAGWSARVSSSARSRRRLSSARPRLTTSARCPGQADSSAKYSAHAASHST